MKLKEQFEGFLTFIREKGVVGLAIGFIIGGAVSKVVASFSEDVVNPLIGLIFGTREGLASLAIGPVRVGNFATILIDFIIVAAVVYFGFKLLRLEKLDKKKDA